MPTAARRITAGGHKTNMNMKKRKLQLLAFVGIGLLLLVCLVACPESEFVKRLNQNANLFLAILTMVYVVLTYLILNSTRKTSLEQTRPFVFASLPVEGFEVLLSIKNVGNRPAYNVVISFNPSLDVLSTSQLKGTYEPLLNQSFLPPNFELRNMLNSTVEVLQEGINLPTFDVTLSYLDSDGNPFTHNYTINLGSYVFNKKGVDYPNRHYLESISESLKKIGEHLKSGK